ncbi:hypothetical protein K227x_25650 [Rubripirellula lacrimiformis]|uniref:TQO small subunit DoxD domain-containing protein n=2 Tax=Rubripirellula lacrimiformis TaxID=1930273 RepID=A0A517NAL0_9BACT|nr:hypothetical protein K227x_25650 [Rubripirellula lacrimiformis]
MLVLLRISVGWHFYSEGMDKYAAGNFSAAPFFANAKGPMAGQFRGMVWDADGKLRLNEAANQYYWAVYRDQIIAHYGFDEAQTRRAQINYKDAVEQYQWVIAENSAELEEFELGRDRIALLETDESERTLRDGVASLGGQRDTIRREWLGKAAPALSQIDKIWDNYAAAQNAVATPEQADAHASLKLVKPRTGRIDTSVIDGIIPYFDIAVGLCLLLGFFTPIAGLAAAGFLGSVFLSQYPPTTGPSSSNYQLIECMACLVLASTGAGRFAGLDFFLHLIVRKFWYRDEPEIAT